MKRLLASIALMSLVGCVHAEAVYADLEHQPPYGVISMGPNIAYLVDVRTESCLLVYANTAAAQVSCAKLKKNVPEAGRYITWDVSTEGAPAPAPHPMPPPPPPVPPSN